jgi:hypothetical protein
MGEIGIHAGDTGCVVREKGARIWRDVPLAACPFELNGLDPLKNY